MLGLLVEAGADINKTDKNGETPFLMLCARALPDKQAVAWLLEHGASVNAQGEDGETALLRLLDNWAVPLELVEFLLSQGADPGLSSAQGATPLQVLKERPKMEPPQERLRLRLHERMFSGVMAGRAAAIEVPAGAQPKASGPRHKL